MVRWEEIGEEQVAAEWGAGVMVRDGWGQRPWAQVVPQL